MKCAYCGKTFETKDGRVRYCSKECRHKAYLSQLKNSNKERRKNNPEYRKRTYATNLRRYYEKKHGRYEEIAKELIKVCGDVEAMTEILEENCRLRH